MNWWLIGLGFGIGVSMGLIRLAYSIGYANGRMDGFSRGVLDRELKRGPLG